MYCNEIEELTFKLQGWHFYAFPPACSHGSVGRWRVEMRSWCHHLLMMACKGKKRNCYLWQCRTYLYKMYLLVIQDKDVEIPLFGLEIVCKCMARFHTFFQWSRIKSFPLSACLQFSCSHHLLVLLATKIMANLLPETELPSSCPSAESRGLTPASTNALRNSKVPPKFSLDWTTGESWKQFMHRVNALSLNSYAKKILLPETPKTTLQNLKGWSFWAGDFFILSFGFWGFVADVWRFWIITRDTA